EMSVWNGHYGCTCYHPLFVFNQFGDLERCALVPATCTAPTAGTTCSSPLWRATRAKSHASIFELCGEERRHLLGRRDVGIVFEVDERAREAVFAPVFEAADTVAHGRYGVKVIDTVAMGDSVAHVAQYRASLAHHLRESADRIIDGKGVLRLEDA